MYNYRVGELGRWVALMAGLASDRIAFSASDALSIEEKNDVVF